MAAKNAVSLPSTLDTPDVHLNTMSMFRLEAAQTNNQSVLLFTQSELPKLEETLDQIETVSQRLSTVQTATLK